jgi:hypothetical protein
MSIDKYPRIRLHWIDILGDTGWADEDEFQDMKCSTCVSEGHLFHKDENSVMTFASYEIEERRNYKLWRQKYLSYWSY